MEISSNNSPFQFNNYNTNTDPTVIGGHVYEYDNNGNMVGDNRLERSIYYNFLNLPQEILLSTNPGSVSQQAMIEYTYTATGQKVSQQMVSNGNPGTRQVIRWYFKGFGHKPGNVNRGEEIIQFSLFVFPK